MQNKEVSINTGWSKCAVTWLYRNNQHYDGQLMYAVTLLSYGTVTLSAVAEKPANSCQLQHKLPLLQQQNLLFNEAAPERATTAIIGNYTYSMLALSKLEGHQQLARAPSTPMALPPRAKDDKQERGGDASLSALHTACRKESKEKSQNLSYAGWDGKGAKQAASKGQKRPRSAQTPHRMVKDRTGMERSAQNPHRMVKDRTGMGRRWISCCQGAC
eukprot:283792-Pelagomonas_calceolata.AAC.5